MSTTTKTQTADDRMQWSGFEFPWGATQCAPYHDDKDRVIVRWADVPAEWQTEEGETVRKPRVAPGTPKDLLYAVYSWMNDRVMFLLSDDGSGSLMSWSTCGECAAWGMQCTCRQGITESRSIQWARRRNSERWTTGSSKVSAIMRDAATATDDEAPATPRQSAPRATPGRSPQTGRTKPAQGRTGHARATADDDAAPTLAEIDAQAGSTADDLVEEAMSTGSRNGTGRRGRRR